MDGPDFLSYLNTLPTSLLPDAITSKLSPTSATAQMATALLTALATRLAALLASLPQPAIFVVALVAILCLISFVHRIVTFITRLALRLLFWALVAGVVAVVYERGVEGSLEAAKGAYGYAYDMGVFFWGEWERFERGREREGKMRSHMAY